MTERAALLRIFDMTADRPDVREVARLALAATPSAQPEGLDGFDHQRAIGLVLHAEAVHGCEHTAQMRAELGLTASPEPVPPRAREETPQ